MVGGSGIGIGGVEGEKRRCTRWLQRDCGIVVTKYS